jgi:hypothetical protein
MMRTFPSRFIALMVGLLQLAEYSAAAQEFRVSPFIASESQQPSSRGFSLPLFGPRSVKVLLIGDSLSFGPFGEHLERLLKEEYGSGQVCVFASCGSSPENWVDGTPVYMTKCGYRQDTPNPRECFVRDFLNGHAPDPVPTPKLSRIFSLYHPDIVLIQQGTNWMDRFQPSKKEEYKRIGYHIRDLVSRIQRDNQGVQIIWILPPSAAKYPAVVQTQISNYIRRCGTAYHFLTIDSRRITGPYLKGISGRDGVHYSADPARIWADKCYQRIRELVKENPVTSL